MTIRFPVSRFLLPVSSFLFLSLTACPPPSARRAPTSGALADAKNQDERPPPPPPPPPPGAPSPAAMDDERIPGLDRTEAELAVALEPHLQRARAALSAQDLDGAIAAALAALAVQSDHIEALRLLAEAYVARGWLDKARAVLDVGTELPAGERDAGLWMLLGLVREQSGAPADQAERAYREATRLKPNYAAAWTNLGALQLRDGRTQEAMASLETAQSIDSESVTALTNLGTAYRRRASEVVVPRDRTELLRKAERSYRTAILLDEDSLAAYLDLGLLYFDADPFPGLATAARLQAAVRYLHEYKQRTASGAPPAAPIDDYLDAARRALEREQRRIERGGRKSP